MEEKQRVQKWENIKIATLIGWCFAVMFFLGIFAEFVVRTQLINWEDPIVTYTNIRQSKTLFDAGIFAFIIIIILDILLSIFFLALFHALNKTIAVLMFTFRILYVAVKGFAIVGLFLARDVYSIPVEISAGQLEVYANEAMQFLKMHHYGFSLGLILFGLHLIFLAILLLKINKIPKLIVWMLLIAGFGYSLNSLTSLFMDDIDLVKNVIILVFIIPMTFSELALGIWLWIKASKVFLPD